MSSRNGYGTAEAPAAPVTGSVPGGDEEQPLLRKPESRSPFARLRKSMLADINRDWGDIVLLFCYIITGLLDSASISIWGSFVSMQTGNTVYLGLGIAAPKDSTRWIKSGTSLACFCVGSFFFARFHRFFSPKRRWVLCVSFAAQTALILAAAAVVTFGPQPKHQEEMGWHVLLPIALVAFQSCGQAVTSRALKYNSLTSVVLTSIYCDLFSDADLFAAHNVERNRRAAAPILLLFGATVGGLFAHSSLGIAGALWTAVGLKTLIVITWFLWPGAPDENEE